MKLSDPYKVSRNPKFSFSRHIVHEHTSVKDRDYAIECFQDECIIFTQGYGSPSCAADAAIEVAKNAVWFYRIAKRKHTLWNDREQFAHGMYRSLFLSLRKEQRKRKITGKWCSSLSVLWFGSDSYTVFHTGFAKILLLRHLELYPLTQSQKDEDSSMYTRLIGGTQSYPKPSIEFGKLQRGDNFLLLNEGIAHWVSNKDILEIYQKNVIPESELKTLIQRAQLYGGTDQKVCASICVG